MMKIIFLFFLLFSFSLSLEGVKECVLANGLVVITLERRAVPLVSVQAWVNVGSGNEDETNSGVAHFIEHMLFKGTRGRSVERINEEIESCGGYINAGTARDFTYFYITISKVYLNLALDILSDALQYASFDPTELEKEREVILEELKTYQDRPFPLLSNLLYKNIYEKFNHPYQRPIGGTIESVKNLKREHLISFYKQHYIPENIALVIVGDFDREKAIQEIKKLWQPEKREEVVIASIRQKSTPLGIHGLRKKLKFLLNPSWKNLTIAKTERVIIEREFKQTYLGLAFLAAGVNSADIFALDLISFLLSYGRSARLYQSLKEKKQLVNNISASFLTQKHPGLFIIYAEPKLPETEQVEKAILQEILSLKNLEEEELDKAKLQINTAYIFDNETISDQAYTLGFYHSLVGLSFERNYLKNINQVTCEQIKKVIEKYFQRNHLTVVIKSKLE
jgi:zinc protease